MTLPQREIMNGGHRNELFNYNNLQGFLPIISPNPKTKTTSTLLGLNAHLGSGNNNESEQNKREMSCEQPLMGSSRWNPTAEQLLALEEMYRRGTRTPTAEQIQQIASQLRRFGKIEGKNVFYWFQNHKARDRQKRRRELETGFKVSKHAFDTFGSPDIKESSGLRRTVYEADGQTTVYEADEQTKTLIHPSSCTNHYLKGPVSSTKTTHGWWSQFEERELLQDKSCCSLKKKNATWHAMDWYPSSSPIQLINNNNLTTTTGSSRSRFLNLQRQSKKQNLEIKNLDLDDEQDKFGEVETLELFPLCSNEEDFNNYGTKDEDTIVPIKPINTNLSPNQYFEFFPLKN